MGGVPVSEFRDRAARLEAALAAAGLDMLIAYSVGNQAGPAGFLSGYEPRFGQRDVSIVTVATGRSPKLFAYAYWDRPAEQTWIEDVTVESDLAALATKVAAAVPSAARRIGVAGHLFFPVMFASAIHAAHPGVELVDAGALLMELGRIKSPAEIEILRECARMTDAGVLAFLSGVRPGADEREIAIDVERAMLEAGAERPAFPVLIFSGAQAEVGIGYPSSRPLAIGQQVNIVCGALHRTYKMDIGRATTVGAPGRDARRLLETAAEMFTAMLGTVRPGVAAETVAAAGTRVRSERGMDEWAYRNGPPGYAGHAIGCWLDERPTIKAGERTSLEPGMVLILEARLGRPDAGGAHITEPIVVTSTGAERLGSTPIACWPDA